MTTRVQSLGNRLSPGWVAVWVALATFWLYWPALHCGFVNCDDPVYVTGNPHVLGGLRWNDVGWAFSTGRGGNWNPVTWLSFMLDADLFGKNPAGYHFTNVVFHALNASLLFWLWWSLTKAKWRSAAVAVLFAWHPLHVESVAWVAERKDVLSGFFGILSLLLYAGYTRSTTPPHGARRHPTTFYAASLLAYVLGLMCKPMLVTWPLVLLLLDYWPLERWKTVPKIALLREKIPFMVLALAASAATLWAQKNEGAVAAIATFSPLARCENAVISYGRYLGKLFWPANLACFYPRPAHWPWVEALGALIFLAAVTILVWRQRTGRPFLLMGWLWYVGTLVPVIGLVQVGEQSIADRYSYLPSVGIFVMILWGGAECVRRRPRLALPCLLTSVTVAGFCLALTDRQISYWRNSKTLFQHAVEVTADNFSARNNLGMALMEEGRTEAAIGEYRRAILIKPDFGQAYNNLGTALSKEGRFAEAAAQFRNALRFMPHSVDVHYNLGNLLAQTGQREAAIVEYQTVLRLRPDYVQAHNNLGNVLFTDGRTDDAIKEFAAALHWDPGCGAAHYNLGNALLKKGGIDETISELRSAIVLLPAYAPARYDLGLALTRKGLVPKAIGEFQTAIRLQPDYALPYNDLGVALGGQGRWDEAISEFQTAIRLQPDDTNAQQNLAQAVARKSHAGKNPPTTQP